MTDSMYREATVRLARQRRSRTARRALLGAAVVLAAAGAVVVGTSIAFLSDTARAGNALTVAANDIEIVETFPDPPVVVGEGEVQKEVRIENTGTAPCFVRASVELTDEDVAPYVELAFGSGAWSSKEEDGFYYALDPVEAGALTPPLLEAVRIGDEPDAGYLGFGVIVVAESAQAVDPSTGEAYPDGQSAFAALEGREGGADA